MKPAKIYCRFRTNKTPEEELCVTIHKSGKTLTLNSPTYQPSAKKTKNYTFDYIFPQKFPLSKLFSTLPLQNYNALVSLGGILSSNTFPLLGTNKKTIALGRWSGIIPRLILKLQDEGCSQMAITIIQLKQNSRSKRHIDKTSSILWDLLPLPFSKDGTTIYFLEGYDGSQLKMEQHSMLFVNLHPDDFDKMEEILLSKDVNNSSDNILQTFITELCPSFNPIILANCSINTSAYKNTKKTFDLIDKLPKTITSTNNNDSHENLEHNINIDDQIIQDLDASPDNSDEITRLKLILTNTNNNIDKLKDEKMKEKIMYTSEMEKLKSQLVNANDTINKLKGENGNVLQKKKKQQPEMNLNENNILEEKLANAEKDNEALLKENILLKEKLAKINNDTSSEKSIPLLKQTIKHLRHDLNSQRKLLDMKVTEFENFYHDSKHTCGKLAHELVGLKKGYKKEANSLKNRITKEFEDEIKSAKDMISQKESEIENLQKNIDEKDTEIEDTRMISMDRISELESDLQDMQDKHEKYQANEKIKHKNEINKLHEDYQNDRIIEQAKIEEEIRNTNTEAATTDNIQGETSSNPNDIQQQFENQHDKENAISNQSDNQQKFEKQLDTKDKSTNKSTMTTTPNQVDSSLSQLIKKKIAEFECVKKDNDERIKELKIVQEKQEDDLNTKNQALKEKLEASKKDVDVQNQELNDNTERIKELEIREDDLITKNQVLKDKLEATNKNFEDQNQELNDLRTKYDNALSAKEGDVLSVQGHINDLTDHVALQKEKNQKLIDDKNEEIIKIQEKEKECRANLEEYMKKLYEDLKQRLEVKDDENQVLTTSVNDLHKEIRKNDINLQSNSKMNDDLVEQIQIKDEENQTLSNKMNDLNEENQQQKILLEKNNNLMEELKIQQEDNQKLRATISDLKEEVAFIKNELNNHNLDEEEEGEGEEHEITAEDEDENQKLTENVKDLIEEIIEIQKQESSSDNMNEPLK